MKNVIELIRVSTKQQAAEDRASIPAQKALCKQLAAQHKLDIAWTVQMEDVSGAVVMYSPEMQRLIELVRSGQVHGIVTREWSRLLRPENPSDYVILEILNENRVMVYLPDGPIDLTTSSGMFMGQIQLAVAGLERRQTRDRSFGAKEQMRREGRAASAPQTWPFGVAWTHERGWYWTDEVEKVVRLFELFTSGTTSWKDLSVETAIPYPNIPVILRNPIYSGWKVYDQKRDGSMKGKVLDEHGHLRYQKKVKRSAEEIIRVRVFDQGIVSDAMWTKAQQLLTWKKETHQRRGKGEGLDRFLYRGFLKCACCSEIMYTIPKQYEGKVRDYYICRRKRGYGQAYKPGQGSTWIVAPGTCQSPQLQRERLEETVNRVLSEQLTDAEFLDGLLDRHADASKKSDNRQRITRVQREIAACAEKRERLDDLYIDGKLSKDQHAQRLLKLEQELSAARRTLAELTAGEMPTGLDAEELAELLAPFHDFEFLGTQEKRQMLATIVPAIKVHDYKVHGVYLLLAGERDGFTDDGPQDGAALSGKPCRTAKAMRTRVNTNRMGVVNELNRHATAFPIDHPIYIPLIAG